MREIVLFLIFSCLQIATNSSSLQNLYLKPVQYISHKILGSLIDHQIYGDFFYIMQSQRVEKWNYKQPQMVKYYYNQTRNNLQACFICRETQQLVVAYRNNGNSSIVVWNQTTCLENRSLVLLEFEIVNMKYLPLTKQLIVSTAKNGRIFIIDFYSLSIKQSYSTNTNLQANIAQKSTINTNPHCSIALLLKNLDQNLIFDANERPIKILNRFNQITNKPNDIAVLADNCEQIFYIERDLLLQNKTYYSTLTKHSKKSNFSKAWQKKIPVLQQIRSVKILDQKKSIFLFFEDAQLIIYDNLKDQSHFSLINQKLINESSSIKRVLMNDNKKQLLIVRNGKTFHYKIQCKGLNYFNSQQTACLRCQKNCLQCSQNYQICSSCNQGYFTSGIYCPKCELPCKTCEGFSKNCTSCPIYYVNQGNTCVIDKLSILYAISVVASVASSLQFRSSMQLVSFLNELWPYYYHKRNYSQKTDNFLEMIHTVENNKWLVGGLDKQINFTFSHLKFSDYNSYSNEQLISKQNKSNYFWDTTFQFFSYCMPCNISLCLLLNVAFRLLFNYKYSVLIRKYAFLMTFIVSVMESNLIYVCFSSMNNFSVLFFFKFQDKLGHICSILFAFVLIIYIVAIFYLIQYLYQKLAKYFIEECRVNILSFTYYTIMNIQSLLIGVIQAFLHKYYQYQIWAFVVVELLTIASIITIERNFPCFKQRSFLFALLSHRLVMVIFNIVLWVDYTIKGMQQLNQFVELFDSLVLDIIYLLTGIVLLKIITSFLPSQFDRPKNENSNLQERNKQGNQKATKKDIIYSNDTYKRKNLQSNKKDAQIVGKTIQKERYVQRFIKQRGNSNLDKQKYPKTGKHQMLKVEHISQNEIQIKSQSIFYNKIELRNKQKRSIIVLGNKKSKDLIIVQLSNKKDAIQIFYL